MRHLLFMAAVVFSINSSAMDEQVLDQLVWDYSGFVSSFESKDWEQVFLYITDDTKAGLGGEQGIEGVKSIYVNGSVCFDNMLFALKQGCKKVDSEKRTECIAPPQWADPDVISLGARASFVYSEKSKKWVAGMLICGGD